jgi:anti-sigma B factor antagonist
VPYDSGVELSIAVTRTEAGRSVLRLDGSVDLVSKDEFVDAGRAELQRPGCAQLAIDLSAVTFMDSSGLGALVTLDNEAESRQVGFAVLNPSERVDRLLTLTGLRQRYVTGG